VAQGRLAIAPESDDAAVRTELAVRALRRGFHRLVLAEGDPSPVSEIAIIDRFVGDRIVGGDPARPTSRRIVAVRTPEDLAAAMEVGHREGGVIVAWSEDRVIPLENLIADGRGRYEVGAIVERLSDLPAMLGALEHGADRVIVRVHHPADLDRVEALVEAIPTQEIAWELLPIQRVTSAGVGDRVIVDTTSMLRGGEGMLVGSAAAVLLHVASEAVGSRFTRPRPFRVNAGAAHMYTLLADGATRYLSELVAGDAVLIAEPRGSVRSARVGRIKIERRPLTMVEVARGPRTYTAFLQEAETVRLSSETGPVATTHLAASSRVFGAAFPAARHLGGVVEETIDER